MALGSARVNNWLRIRIPRSMEAGAILSGTTPFERTAAKPWSSGRAFEIARLVAARDGGSTMLSVGSDSETRSGLAAACLWSLSLAFSLASRTDGDRCCSELPDILTIAKFGAVSGGSASLLTRLPNSSFAQYPRSGVGMWWRSHVFFNAVPVTP